MARGFQLTFDAHDPRRLAAFWAEALGYIEQPPPPGFDSWEDFARKENIPEERWNDMSAVIEPDGSGQRVLFIRVPEGKTAKNRLHMDVNVGGGHDVPLAEQKAAVLAEADRLVGLGATQIEPRTEFGSYWIVMQDPEGNEFCLQ